MGKKHDCLKHLQVELLRVQRWLRHRNKRLLVIFEGRDAAGKGGTIKRITKSLDTRNYRIVALGKPTEAEEGQWYFQRYVPHLPQAGEMVLFDRSWYNRAVVEPAMEFCTPAQYDAFMDAVPVFEKQLTDDGIILIKYWLAVDQAKEEQRFAERVKNPLKRWKLSPTDLACRQKYAQMGELRDVMIERTDAAHAPWFVVDYNDQKMGRLTLIRHLLTQIPYEDEDIPAPHVPKLKKKPGKENLTPRATRVPTIEL